MRDAVRQTEVRVLTITFSDSCARRAAGVGPLVSTPERDVRRQVPA